MLGGGSITLFHVRGIRIAVDWSWFLVLFLVIFWLSQLLRERARRAQLGVRRRSSSRCVSAVGFFGSIVLHELGHAFVAMRNGIGITSIQLWIFGGVARMDRESDSPATEFKVAIAGPAGDAGDRRRPHRRSASPPSAPHEFQQGDRWSSRDSGVSGVLAMVAWLASINVLVLVFNLLPAFPMDGGRDRPRDRLVADRRPRLGDPLRRQPRARLRLPLHRRRSRCSSSRATSSPASGWR